VLQQKAQYSSRRCTPDLLCHTFICTRDARYLEWARRALGHTCEGLGRVMRVYITKTEKTENYFLYRGPPRTYKHVRDLFISSRISNELGRESSLVYTPLLQKK
jgi:hypothetical protein